MVKKPNTKENEFVPATGKYVYVEFGDVVTILSMINEHGQSEELSALTKGLEHVVRIPSSTANIVKKFIADHPEMRQSPTGEKVLCPKAEEESPDIAPGEIRGSVASAANRVPLSYSCKCGFNPGG